MPGQALM